MVNPQPTRLFTREEVAARNQRENLTIIIDNIVYDVSDFVIDHPGGQEVLLDNGGKDASQCFHDVGHSDAALDWQKQMKIGEVVEAERRTPIKEKPSIDYVPEPITVLGMLKTAIPPVVLALVAAVIYNVLFS